MTDFIDLKGASGAAYRFRLWPETDFHPPMGGNYVIADGATGALKVRLLGLTNDLSLVKQAGASRPKGRLYTRLNVSQAARRAEHEDLVAAWPEAVVEQQGA